MPTIRCIAPEDAQHIHLVPIHGLFAQFKDVFATDLTPGQIEHLTCLLRETPGTAIIYDGVRPEWTSPGPVANSLLWDKILVSNRLQELGLTP